METTEQYVARWLHGLRQLVPAFRNWCIMLDPERLQLIFTAWDPLMLLQLPLPPGGDARYFVEGLLTQLTQQPPRRIGQRLPTILLADTQLPPANQVGHFEATGKYSQRLQQQLRRQRWAVAPTRYWRESAHISIEAVYGVLYKADLLPPGVYRVLLLQPEGAPADFFYAFAVICEHMFLPLALEWKRKIAQQPDRDPADLAEKQEQAAHAGWKAAKEEAGGYGHRVTRDALFSQYAGDWAHEQYTNLLNIFKAELTADLHAVVPGLRPWWEPDPALWPIALSQSRLLQDQQNAWNARP